MGAKAFKGAHGQYLAAEEGHLYGMHEMQKQTKFHIEEHDGGKKVSLRTHNGHYVAVNVNKEIYMAHSHASDEAKFHLERHEGRVAIKAHHGGYLGLTKEGQVRIYHERTPSELFEEVSV